ncbi:MAG: hypothetical protein HZB87_05755 [Desulfatitalea sp.]|nr:hypothetical protein [Desulfatitalea sp.]
MGHHDHHQPGHAHHDNHPMSFAEKGSKLIGHWIQHNSDHAQNYRQWAAEFRLNQLPQVAALLESAAELTLRINQTLDEAAIIVASAKKDH